MIVRTAGRATSLPVGSRSEKRRYGWLSDGGGRDHPVAVDLGGMALYVVLYVSNAHAGVPH